MASIDMTRDEITAFLRDGCRIVSVASLRKDGAPFVIPVGYEFDGESFYLPISNGRTMLYRIRRDPRVCLTVFNDSYPVVCVIAEGDAEEIEDPGNELAISICTRYIKSVLPDMDMDAYLQPWLQSGRTIVRVTPHRFVAFDTRKNWERWVGSGRTAAV